MAASRPFRIWRWVPLSLLALGTALGLLLAAAPWSSAPTGSVPVGLGSVPPLAVPVGYHVTYRVTGPGLSPYLQQLWVARPFDSVSEILAGNSASSGTALETVTRLGDQVLTTGNSQPALIHVAVAPAGSDVRLDAVLSAALADGYLQSGGTAEVLGRTCHLYRSAKTLADPGAMTVPGGSNYVESCVDADGVVLSEDTFKSGRLTQRRQAANVEIGRAAAAGGNYDLSAAATPFDEGGGSIGALTLDSSPPGLSWKATWIPTGYSHSGRWAITPSQPEAFDQSSSGVPNPLGVPDSLISELVDAFVSGPNVIVVEQGVSAGNNTVFKAPTGGQSVSLGPVLGRGQLTLSGSASVITAEPDGGSHFVRISGTVAPSVLLQVARAVVVEKPGRLVPLSSS